MEAEEERRGGEGRDRDAFLEVKELLVKRRLDWVWRSHVLVAQVTKGAGYG